MWPWSELYAWPPATSIFWPYPLWAAPGPSGPPGDATLCSQQPLPCAEDGGTLQAAAQTLRQIDPHIQTGQTASCSFGDMAWIDWILGWGWMCQWPCRACLTPQVLGQGVCYAWYCSCPLLSPIKAWKNRVASSCVREWVSQTTILRVGEAASWLFPALGLSPRCIEITECVLPAISHTHFHPHQNMYA